MKKINPNPSRTRIGMIRILAGELWYLRQIMLKYPITSWKDAETHNEILYNSFQEAAVARGLVVDKRGGEIVFEEMVLFLTPPELRGFFVMLTINGYSTLSMLQNHSSTGNSKMTTYIALIETQVVHNKRG